MKDLQRRVGRLESEKAAEDDFQLILVDEDLPDGRMFLNGVPVVVKPAKYTLFIHKRARR